MKSKLLLLILAMASAFVVPMAAVGQIAPEKPPKDVTGPVFKYEAYVGYGYTSLNQVNLSRSGLQGVSGSVTRYFGDHFGLKADGGYYAWNVTSTNPGKPVVDMVLVGPVVRGNLFEKWSGYAEGLFGGVHTGGLSIQPDISFAGGFGIGVDYNRSPRWADPGVWRRHRVGVHDSAVPVGLLDPYALECARRDRAGLPLLAFETGC